MPTLLGVLSLVIWLYLLFFHGRFWRLGPILAPAPAPGGPLVRVAAVIPARDEAAVVGQSVTALLSQAGGHSLHIFLVDDSSSDDTAGLARQAAKTAGKPESLTVIEGRALEPGWSGKLWAVEQGLEPARQFDPEFLLLTDADIAHAPESVATLVAIARRGGYDLVSLMVKLHCGTFAERALIPAFVFFFLQLYPPAWIANPRRKMAGAAGGSILIRPEALELAGGIEAIRGEVIDDCALARRVKRTGGRIWLGLTATTRSIRPYRTFSEIGKMISRGAFNQLRHSGAMLLLALVGLTVTYVVPPALTIFSHRWLPTLVGAAAWISMAVCFLPTVRFYRLNPLWVLALPLISIFYMGASLHSAFRFWSGRGGEWKGRVQDPSRSRT
jgi:hopene-associated glycosyltransferase HpnB